MPDDYRQRPSQVIAGCLPLGPDEWITDRGEMADVIVEALENAGYQIITLRQQVSRKPFVIED